MRDGFHDGYVKTDGIQMHYVFAGQGPAVIMLHGFPEHWYSWRYQLEALSREGFTAVAPDLRGYGLTDKPSGGYDLPTLVADVAGLAEGLGFTDYALVGHDWGAVVAWSAAMLLPQVHRLAIFNGPHPGVYLRNLFTTRQFLQSWYVYLFQLPGVAERLLRRNDYELVKKMFRDGQRRAPETISDEDIERLINEMRRPMALECGLKYYRSAFRTSPWKASQTLRKVRVPTSVTWGLKDKALIPDTEAKLKRWVDAPLEINYIEDAGHWVTQERPQRCNEILADFLKRSKAE